MHLIFYSIEPKFEQEYHIYNKARGHMTQVVFKIPHLGDNVAKKSRIATCNLEKYIKVIVELPHPKSSCQRYIRTYTLTEIYSMINQIISKWNSKMVVCSFKNGSWSMMKYQLQDIVELQEPVWVLRYLFNDMSLTKCKNLILLSMTLKSKPRSLMQGHIQDLNGHHHTNYER